MSSLEPPSRASMLSTMPLSIIALAFFLPMTDACNEVVSPLSYVRSGDWASAFWATPTFAAAALLVVAVMRSSTKLAFTAVAPLVATLPVLGILFIKDAAWFMAPLYALATAGSIVLLLRARRKRGAEQLSSLLDAYAVGALPLALAITEMGKYFGAYLFTLAYVAYFTQRAVLLVRSLRTEEPRSSAIRLGDQRLGIRR